MISTYTAHDIEFDIALRNRPHGPRKLPVPAGAARQPRHCPAVRRCFPSAQPDQFPVLAADDAKRAVAIDSRELAEQLATDRTTISTNLKPLHRRRLLTIRRSDADARAKQIALTDAGRALLAEAVSLWRTANDVVKAAVGDQGIPPLRAGLDGIVRVSP